MKLKLQLIDSRLGKLLKTQNRAIACYTAFSERIVNKMFIKSLKIVYKQKTQKKARTILSHYF